jgi:hypothetical protein
VGRDLALARELGYEFGKTINRLPLPESGPVEVGRAAHALDTMQARLIGYIQGRTRVLAAMSQRLCCGIAPAAAWKPFFVYRDDSPNSCSQPTIPRMAPMRAPAAARPCG